MIEIQIDDEAMYGEFKRHASYFSDRTRVLELPDHLKGELEGKGLLGSNSNFIIPRSYDKPVVKLYRDGTLEVVGLGDDLVVRQALRITGKDGVYVKVQNFDLVLELCRLGVVEMDQKSFDAHMPYMAARSARFSDLLFSKVKFRDIGSLDMATKDPETGESPLIGTSLNGRFKKITWSPHVVEVVAESPIKVNWGFGILAKRLKSGSGGGLIRIQMNNSVVARELVEQKSTFAIWGDKPVGESITNPMIVPVGTTPQRSEFWRRTDRRRDIPAALLRNAWIEYNYRRNK